MYQRATTQKCHISARLFLQALVTRVTTITVKARSNFFCSMKKYRMTMAEIQTVPVKHGYTHQRLNRRCKALVPENKPKEVEFWCMLQ